MFTSPAVKRASRNYLRRVYKKTPSWLDSARHVFWFAATILDRVYFLTDQLDKFEIEMHGHEILDSYANKQQGCVLLGAHLGSFDALRSLAINRTKIELKIMMHYDHNAMMMKVLDRLNNKVASAIINLADSNALLQMQEALEQGKFVGMLSDRSTGEKDCECHLLGDPVKMPTGPLSIASIMQVPVVLFFPLYLGKNRYALYFEEFSEPLQVTRMEREKVIAGLAQQYADRLEYYIRKEPLNWFNFYDYWSDEKI